MRILTLSCLVACGPEAPVSPSFQQDVLPIMAANCVRCHGFPAIGGAPPEFRLDSFGDVTVTDGEPAVGCGSVEVGTQLVICGSATYAPLIPARLRGEDRPMPPRFPLDEYERETLENWAADPIRGMPRANNALPTIVVDDIVQTGALVTLQARVTDLDGDLVTGTVHALVAERERVIGSVRSGVLQLAWDTTTIPAGAYPLVAQLDDGAEVHVTNLGTITIEGPP